MGGALGCQWIRGEVAVGADMSGTSSPTNHLAVVCCREVWCQVEIAHQ